MVGLGSTKFRSAQYTSHEVVVDDEQIAWFEDTIAKHPAPPRVETLGSVGARP